MSVAALHLEDGMDTEVAMKVALGQQAVDASSSWFRHLKRSRKHRLISVQNIQPMCETFYLHWLTVVFLYLACHMKQ